MIKAIVLISFIAFVAWLYVPRETLPYSFAHKVEQARMDVYPHIPKNKLLLVVDIDTFNEKILCSKYYNRHTHKYCGYRVAQSMSGTYENEYGFYLTTDRGS